MGAWGVGVGWEHQHGGWGVGSMRGGAGASAWGVGGREHEGWEHGGGAGVGAWGVGGRVGLGWEHGGWGVGLGWGWEHGGLWSYILPVMGS